MKFLEYLSFLKNKNYKVKISFLFIIFLAILIVFADAFSIIALLPLVSLITDPNIDLSQNKIFLDYTPFFIIDFLQAKNTLTFFLILLSTLLIRNLIHLLNNYIIFKFVKFMEVDTSKKIFYLWLNRNYLEFFRKTSSELIKDFRDSIGGYVMFIENVTRFISDFIILILFSIFLLYISFNETMIISFYFILIFFIFKKILSEFSFRHGKITNLSSNKINLTIINTYKNFTQIILRKLKKKFLNLILIDVNQFSYSRLIINFLKSNTKQFFEISIIVFLLIIFTFFNLLNIYSMEDIIALLVIFIVATYRILPQINNLVTSIIKLKNFQYPFSIINDQIEYYNKKYKNVSFDKSEKNTIDFYENLELKNIEFSYFKDQPHILKNLNLSIKKNKTYGIIGKSGSGKTTIIKILLGLIEPNKGELLIDGKKISKDILNNYQNLFGYLSQENLFIPGSIKENIAFGVSKIDEIRVRESLKITNCLEFIEKFKDNINHQITEDGKNFSIGQLQRLALARAIYFDNKILILDEPTSALDTESENQFLKLIDNLKGKKTILIISHKKNTLKNCDIVFKIEDKNLIKANFNS